MTVIASSSCVDDSASTSSASLKSSSNGIALTSHLEKQGYPTCVQLATLNLETELMHNLSAEQNLTGRIEIKGGRFPVHAGGYSDVFIGFLRDNPSLEVAVKILRTTSEKEEIEKIMQRLIREAAVWHRLKHQNVLRFLGLANDLGRFDNCPALIAPYCHKGTSGEHVRRLNPTIEGRVLLILGVARGLEYLHRQDIVHGDLKPSNVLMGDNDEPLLCDFGRSKILELRGFTTKPAGTVRYQAPELFEGEGIPDKSADVCAFGLTAFELWTGLPPYAELRNDNAILRYILLGNAQLQLPNPPPPMTERLWPILSPCLSLVPEDRPSIHAVVQQLEYCI